MAKRKMSKIIRRANSFSQNAFCHQVALQIQWHIPNQPNTTTHNESFRKQTETKKVGSWAGPKSTVYTYLYIRKRTAIFLWFGGTCTDMIHQEALHEGGQAMSWCEPRWRAEKRTTVKCRSDSKQQAILLWNITHTSSMYAMEDPSKTSANEAQQLSTPGALWWCSEMQTLVAKVRSYLKPCPPIKECHLQQGRTKRSQLVNASDCNLTEHSKVTGYVYHIYIHICIYVKVVRKPCVICVTKEHVNLQGLFITYHILFHRTLYRTPR